MTSFLAMFEPEFSLPNHAFKLNSVNFQCTVKATLKSLKEIFATRFLNKKLLYISCFLQP